MSVTLSDSVRHLTYEQAAAELGVSVRTVYRRVKSGRLGTIERDGRQLVSLTGVNAPDRSRPLHFPSSDDSALGRIRDAVADSARQASDATNERPDLEMRIIELEAERDHLRGTVDKLSDSVSKLSDTVSELNRTVQAQLVTIAQREGRVLQAGGDNLSPPQSHDVTATEPPEPAKDSRTPPRGLRGLWWRLRGR